MYKIHLYLPLHQYFPLQFLFVLGIISILILVALQEYSQPRIKASATEALTAAGVIKQEISLYHAISGDWPDTDNLPTLRKTENGEPLYHGLEIKNGSFKISFDTKNSSLGIRHIAFHRVELAGAVSNTVFWDCRTKTNLRNVIIHREFETNLPEDYLPSICKASK